MKKTLSNDLQNDFWPLIHVKSFQSSNITWYKVHIPICSHLKVCKSGLKWAIHSWILLFLWKWPNQWVTVGHETHFFPYQKVLGKICQKHNHQAFLKFNLIPKIFPVFQKLSKKWYHKYNRALISVYSRLPNKRTGYVYQFLNFFPGGTLLFEGYVYWIWRFLNTKLELSQKNL